MTNEIKTKTLLIDVEFDLAVVYYLPFLSENIV